MAFHQRDKIPLSVARQRRLAEVRIGREKIFRRDVEVGEVAAPAAGDENFFADAIAMFDDQHAPAALARLDGAHQARGACADHNHVELNHLKKLEQRNHEQDCPSGIGSSNPDAR